MKVTVISLYELGRAPLALANLAPRLRDRGFELELVDLSLERFQPQMVADARLVALSIPMYTATRLAVSLVGRIRAAAPSAQLAAFGLYAPLNEVLLRGLGFQWILGGECEDELVALAQRLAEGAGAPQERAFVSFTRIPPRAPDRNGLPGLDRYAKLRLGSGERLAAYVESSRGCKHVCRHCPVVPIYEGHFNVLPVDQVLADIRAEVARGAQHV
ncbi:MAG TPA: CUAEP/CCAEP-tail radical SAM protein, partial [Acidiferrobacteraceae bacterium]|nr:CUAEP/CCAEP-tail radical SAM protein [Acidiferrobacteraceae bacterium]